MYLKKFWGDVKKVVDLGGTHLKLGGGEVYGPTTTFGKKTTTFLFWHPFDPGAFRTCKNTIKLWNVCCRLSMVLSYLGLVKDRLSSWLSVQTLNIFLRNEWQHFYFLNWAIIFPTRVVVVRAVSTLWNVPPNTTTIIFTSLSFPQKKCWFDHNYWRGGGGGGTLWLAPPETTTFLTSPPIKTTTTTTTTTQLLQLQVTLHWHQYHHLAQFVSTVSAKVFRPIKSYPWPLISVIQLVCVIIS